LEFDFFQPHLAYLEIDSLIFFPTFFISIISKVKRRYKSLLLSMVIVSPLYLAWDFLATWVGSWHFNPKWVLGIYVFDLPLEEVLFFFVTPFATLLIYDFITQKFKDKEVDFITKKRVVIASAFLLVMAALLFSYSYTSVDLLYLAISFLVVEYFDESMFRSRNYWAFLLLTYVPFFVFDYFLTSLPVVIYGPHSILGFRILTIPWEDAVYSFSMMNFYALFYRQGVSAWRKV